MGMNMEKQSCLSVLKARIEPDRSVTIDLPIILTFSLHAVPVDPVWHTSNTCSNTDASMA